LSTGGLLDSAYDPIASPEHPFRGDFILSGGLSALGDIIANGLTIKNAINIEGNTTTQNQTIVGSLELHKQHYGGTAIYAINPTTNPQPYTLSINYQNGVFVSDNFYVGGNTITNDITANGTIYGKLPAIGIYAPNTWDISSSYYTLCSLSANWTQATTWVNTNSSNMSVNNLLVTGNLTALGSTTLVNLTTNTSDSLSVVNVGLAVPAIYAEIVTADKPVLSLKQNGIGPILSATSTNSTFIIGNSGWVGIGGTPSTQLDIYALSSTVDGGNLKLRGATGSSKNYVVSVKNSNLNFSHTPTNSDTKTVAMAVTPSNQLSINAESVPGWAGTDPKLYVAGGFLLSGSNQTIVENIDYQNIYNYDNMVPERGGAITRIYNLSGNSATPLSGFSSNPGYNAPGYYTAWSMRVYPYVGGTLGSGYGALGGGGVARIDIGYEGLQSQAELKGVISFATLCASQITSVPGTVERMRINSVGNVGIGISLPTYRLHVLGDNDNDINFMTNGTLGVYNKLDANRSYGFLSVSQQYTLLGSNLRLSGETASPVYKKGTNARAGAGILIYNANGTNAIPTTKFVYSPDTDNDLYTVSESMVISGADVIIPGNLYINGDFYGNATYRSLTSNWQNTYSTVNSNSATTWSYQGADLKALTGNWQNTYSTVSTMSAIWSSTLPTDHTKWDSTYNTVSSLSSNWQNTYSTVNSNSATTWSYQGADLKALTGNWQNTYSTVNSNSATWNAVTTYVKFKSYSETSVTVSIPGTFIYAVDLSQGTVFPITLDKNITSFQLQNIPTGVNSFLILLTQDGTGGKTVTWAFTGKTIKWSGGAPTVTSTANATDIYSFMSVDGNTWYGSVAGKNFV
jgi:hypothetical protein